MRICVECRHHEGERTGPWHSHRCGALARQKGRDPVTGETGYLCENDLGRLIIDEYPHPYCREINTDGECPRWEPM